VYKRLVLGEPSHRTRGLRAGADDYLGKPFDRDELLSRVAVRLRQAAQMRQQRRAAVNASLLAIGNVAASERVGDVVARVTDLTRDLLWVTTCAVMLWDARKGAFVPAGCSGLGREEETLFRSLRLPSEGTRVVEEYIVHATPFSADADEPSSLARWVSTVFRRENLVVAPMVHAQELYGLLIAGRDDPAKVFGDEDTALLASIGRQTGAALANLRTIEQLGQQAVTDPLTGLYNPRYLREFLIHDLARARRAGEPTTAVMLDLDHFKEVNDLYGHAVGDRVLVAVAAVIRSCVRDSDAVARYGGEEFAVVLSGADTEQAAEIAHRIVRRVRELRIAVDGAQIQITVSAGVGTAHIEDDAASLLRAADAALYEAKRAGRDCVR
jgi:diguanylate cyclase (GGDEF)-like protein